MADQCDAAALDESDDGVYCEQDAGHTGPHYDGELGIWWLDVDDWLSGSERAGQHSFTRPQLIDALTHLEAYPATAGPGQRVFISAESMADGIIEALETERRRAFRASLRPGPPDERMTP